MDEELTSGREIIDLPPSQALDRAQSFLTGQGYVVVHRTATTLMVEREDWEDPNRHEDSPQVVIIAVPQTQGGVRIKVRGDSEVLRERQGLWKLWTENLPKRRG